MCPPALIAAMGTAGMGTALSIMSSVMAYGEAQSRADANEQAANAAALNDYRQLNLQQREQEDAEADAEFNADIKTAKALAHAQVASGESGVSGLSVDALYADILRENYRDDTRRDTNLDSYIAQVDQEKKGVESGRQSRVNDVARPNLLATGIEIGGKYNTYKTKD
jgi:hypothetical protein